MYLCNSGFALHRRQGGFIQGAILFALVIIAVVVAAFSLASQDNQTSADTEEAKVNATYVLKVGTDLQNGINRAIADGVDPAQVDTQITFGNVSDTTTVALWDPALRYLAAAPRFPDAVRAAPGTAPGISWVAPANAGFGGAGDEQVIQITGIAEAVCQRINNLANATVITATIPATLATATALGWREGCHVGAAVPAHTYFRVVLIDV
jgi:hypothetical protein